MGRANWGDDLRMIATLSATVLAVLLCVAIHLEALSQLWRRVPRLRLGPRLKVGVAVLGALLAHLLEITLFAVVIELLRANAEFGELRGRGVGSSLDSMYFSLVAYTSLGFGDITPTGVLRLLTGVETLTGLVLIAWTASFLFLQMQHNWVLTHSADH